MGKVWVPEAKEVKTQPSACKVVATLFLDAKALLYLDFFIQEKYNDWSVLCKLARPAENRHP